MVSAQDARPWSTTARTLAAASGVVACALLVVGGALSLATTCADSDAYGDNEHWLCQGTLGSLVPALELAILALIAAGPAAGGLVSARQGRWRPLVAGLVSAVAGSGLLLLVLGPQQGVLS